MLGQSGAVKERERDALHDTVKSGGGGAGGVLYTAEFDSPEGGGVSFRGLIFEDMADFDAVFIQGLQIGFFEEKK
jgi:hypothetical protein